MSKDQWAEGFGLCDCTDDICETIKGPRSTHSHKKGNCHHSDGTHHPIHSSHAETQCPKCEGHLISAASCHVHPSQCCSKCEWGR